MQCMKIIIVFFCVGYMNALFAQDNGKTKHALLFGIATYQDSNYWNTLSSMTDMAYLSQALQKQGFAANNIQQVINEQVTLTGIKEALVNMIGRVKENDIVVIHFSCHGRQVEADSDNKLDGIDECIAPYDAAGKIDTRKPGAYEKAQATYLRGHVLGDLLKQLRQKLGKNGDLAVFMDFCHSGSATRGENVMRGGKPALVSENFSYAKHKNSDSSILIRATVAEKMDERLLAPYVVISATRPEEPDSQAKDADGNAVGSLSYALFQSFGDLEPNTTYRSFFAKIQSLMNISVPEQHPLLEGNGVDRKLLGGEFVEQKPYIGIDSIRPNNQLRLKGGKLSGLNVGAKVAIYPTGTSDPSKVQQLASGKIISADNFFSIVQPDTKINLVNAVDGWVFITEQVFDIKPVTVNVSKFAVADESAIRNGLRGFSSVVIGVNPELLIVKGVESDSIKVASNGYVFAAVDHATTHMETLKEKLKQYAQYKFLKTLQTKEEGISVDVKLVPVINGTAELDNIQKRMVNGRLELLEGDTVKLYAKNTGIEKVYINILDMQPDGIINAILPNEKEDMHAVDLHLEPGKSTLFGKYMIVIGPPYGTEVFKIFASSSEIDLEKIATSKGSTARGGNLSVLESLVKDSFDGVASRGSSPANANGTTSGIIFRIKPNPQK
jgi:hypothetical protein